MPRQIKAAHRYENTNKGKKIFTPILPLLVFKENSTPLLRLVYGFVTGQETNSTTSRKIIS